LLQNIPPAPVWNRGRGRGRGKFQPTSVHVPQNLEDAILVSQTSFGHIVGRIMSSEGKVVLVFCG